MEVVFLFLILRIFIKKVEFTIKSLFVVLKQIYNKEIKVKFKTRFGSILYEV